MVPWRGPTSPRGLAMSDARVPLVLLALLIAMVAWGYRADLALADGETSIEGQVVNGTPGGGSVAGLTVVLHQDGMGEHLDMETTTDSQGRFHLSGVQPVPGFVYAVSVDYQGPLYGHDLDLTAGEATSVTLTVYDTTDNGDVLRATSVSILFTGVEQRGQWVWALEMATIQNSSDRVYVPGPDPTKVLRFGLPPGAEALQVQADFVQGDVLQVDRGFGLTASVPPGDHDILFTYRFPYAESTIPLTRSLPYGTEYLQVLIPQGDVQVTSPQMEGPEPVIIGSLTYQMLTARDLPKGAQMAMTLVGLPQASLWDRLGQRLEDIPFLYASPVALGLVATLVVAYALLRRRGPRPLSGERPGSPLAEARQELLQALAALDQRFEGGVLDAQAYAGERRSLLQRLVAVERAEGTAAAGKPQPEGTPSPHTGEGPSS